MKVLEKILTTILLLVFLTDPSTASIKSIKIQSDDRSAILLQKFGFTHRGNLSITISNISVTDPTSLYDPSVAGFFLVSDETLTTLLFERQHNPNFCILKSNFQSISLLFTLNDISDPHSSFHKPYISNMYALFFANCNPLSVVTMNVRTEMYNNVDDGATKDYLSVGLTKLLSLYHTFFFIYLICTQTWVILFLQNKQLSVNRIHFLMCALLITKAVSLLCDSQSYYYVKLTGTSQGWNTVFWVFLFINDVLLFALIVLIGAGLPCLKAFLHAREKIVLMVVIFLRVLADVASMVMYETGFYNKDWMSWKQVFMWADAISCAAIILPVGWSVTSLTEASKYDKTSERNLTIFARFYRLVLFYLLFTRVGVLGLMDNFATYEYRWACSAAREVASLVLYLVMFYMFRPTKKSDWYRYIVCADALTVGY